MVKEVHGKMTERNEDETKIEMDNKTDAYDDASSDDIKQQAGELLKAAGGFAGSLGKLAIKKGTQLKEKLEDEEFQEKVNANIKAVTDRIDNYVSSDSAKGRTVIGVKGAIDVSDENQRTVETLIMEQEPEKQVVEIEVEDASRDLAGNNDEGEQIPSEAGFKKVNCDKSQDKKRLGHKKKIFMLIAIVIIVLALAAKIAMHNNDYDDKGAYPVESEEADATDEELQDEDDYEDLSDSRQEAFEEIVYDNADEYKRITVTSISGGFVHFDWKTKKGTTALYIEFNTTPGDISWSAGWMPSNAYGPDPISFANSICNDIEDLDD